MRFQKTLVSRMMDATTEERQWKDETSPTLTRKQLGLDEATFKKLDTNGDGVLDSKELGGFVKRTPDIELVLRLGKKKDRRSACRGRHRRRPLAVSGQVHGPRSW